MFEKIQKAYELLLPIVESGAKIQALSEDDGSPDSSSGQADGIGSDGGSGSNEAEGLGGGLAQMQSIHLLLRTQLLVCRRHPDEMGKYKYPVYKILLDCLRLPPSCKDGFAREDGSSANDDSLPCLLKKKRADFTQTAVSLVFETCAVSPLNAEELVANGGICILSSLLAFFIDAIPFLAGTALASSDKVVGQSKVLEIITEIVHTLSGVAFFSSGREAIHSLEDLPRFCLDWKRCTEGSFGSGVSIKPDHTISMVRYSLEGIAHMTKSEKLQGLLVGSGVCLPLLRYMMAYDPTLEQVQISSEDQDDVQLSQGACNLHARLSARALGMLCGVLQDESLQSPDNRGLFAVMERVLTPQLARMLRNKRTGDLLRTLNTNIETPTRIWNVGMRRELADFLEAYQTRRPADMNRSPEEEMKDFGGDFDYVSLKHEVVIGGVYIRVFNGMGGDKAAIHEIPNLSLFAKQILNFLAQALNISRRDAPEWVPLLLFEGDEANKDNEASPMTTILDAKFGMALVSLKALVHVDGLIDDVLCEPNSHAPSILLSLLELPQKSEVRVSTPTLVDKMRYSVMCSCFDMSILVGIVYPCKNKLTRSLLLLLLYPHLNPSRDLPLVVRSSLLSVQNRRLPIRSQQNDRSGVYCKSSNDQRRERRRVMMTKKVMTTMDRPKARSFFGNKRVGRSWSRCLLHRRLPNN